MSKLFDLTGKKAIVTGGSRGLGRGMAEGLMEHGAEAVIFGTNASVLDTAQELRGKGLKCQGLIVDLADRQMREEQFYKAVELLGGVDILVNCAGIVRRHKSEEFPVEDWDLVMEVNLNAVFHLSQLAAREMLKINYGKIINVASMLSWQGGMTVPSYAASKGGVAQLTKAFGNEWIARGINVNAIAPGYMATDINTALLDPANPRYRQITDRIPAGRWGTPEDLKGVCVFLASAASDYLSGAVIPVDGGYLVR